jgi:8-oxo-dGTP diphosphatase
MKTEHDSETLAVGQQVITACAFIHHKFGGVEKVFLPKRAQTKKFLPGVFELPGGHIDFAEDIRDGLAREIQEEFGKSVVLGDPFAAFTYENPIKHAHAVEVVYFAVFEGSIDDINLNPEDHSEYRWVGLDEIDTIYSENKDSDDGEMKVIRRGLELLNGYPINLGSK